MPAAHTRPTNGSRPPTATGTSECSVVGGRRLTSGASTPKGASTPARSDGREVVRKAVGTRTLDCNREDAPIPTRKAGTQVSAQRRGCRYCPVQHEGSHQVHTLLVAPSTDLTRGHHEHNPVGLVREFGVLPPLVPARDRKRGPIALVGTVANATG